MASKLGETAEKFTASSEQEARAAGRRRALDRVAERMEGNRMRYIREICRKGMRPFTRSCPSDTESTERG